MKRYDTFGIDIRVQVQRPKSGKAAIRITYYSEPFGGYRGVPEAHINDLELPAEIVKAKITDAGFTKNIADYFIKD